MTAPWWQTALLYQVYPRSFADADGDGIGDLPGIASRLDYIAELGADAIWLSPIFRSPMADFGYDVADYRDVDPLFGSLDDLDRLIADAHARGLRVILDFVPNHSSDEHPWFVESRSSRTSPKRDWYLWRDAKPDGSPPNDWVGYFGGSTWEWDAETGQYYLHLFHRKQPDLNWRNPEVRAAMYDVMRFWLDRGIDGFRIDVLWLLVKHAEFIDHPPPPELHEGETPWTRFDRSAFEDLPETHEIVREMRALTDEYDDRVLIGEIYLPLARLVTYYGKALDGIHLPFNFSLVTMGSWDAATIRRVVDAYEATLPEGAWPNWVLGNHDMPRVATRSGPAARLAQMLLLTLRGTATAYYGDELGMEDVPIAPELVVDPQAATGENRDPERTPMQWDGGPNAGFAPPDAKPWLPLEVAYRERNVETERGDPTSMLALFTALADLRRRTPALHLGSHRSLDAGDDVFAYVRELDGARVLVALHFSAEPVVLDLSSEGEAGTVLLATGLDREGAVDLARLEVAGWEGVIVRL